MARAWLWQCWGADSQVTQGTFEIMKMWYTSVGVVVHHCISLSKTSCSVPQWMVSLIYAHYTSVSLRKSKWNLFGDAEDVHIAE